LSAVAEAAPPVPKTGRLRDVLALGKPRLSSLVMVTAGGGVYLAPGALTGWRIVVTLVATAVLVGAANALNCYAERDIDAVMLRTRTRPLPARRLEPWVALAVGWGGAALALPALWLAANALTALLGALAFFLYVFVYTPMKRVSPAALFVGAVPGAMPPLMGWTAVCGHIDAGGLALFAILFFWQLPHFLAIALYLKDDYARVRLRICSLLWSERTMRGAILGTSILMVPVSLAPAWLGMTNRPYGYAAIGLGVLLAALSFLPRGEDVSRWARTVFLASTGYLTLLFAALMLGAP
jgi:heme o synthase